MDIAKLGSDMSESLEAYENAIQEEAKAAAKEDLNAEDPKSLLRDINRNATELKKFLQMQQNGALKALEEKSSDSPRSMREGKEGEEDGAATESALSPQEYQLSGSRGVAPAKSAMVNNKEYWTCTSEAAADGDTYFQANFRRARSLTAISIQGGVVSTQAPPRSVPPKPAPVGGPPPPSSIHLPCGLTLAECRGDAELTRDALADVIDWVALLKKNPPEKFLKRPPVRFLFDLLKFVHESCGLFPDSIGKCNWDDIGNSKQGKLDFMNEVNSI